MKKTFMSRVFALLFPREAAYLHHKMAVRAAREAEVREMRARRAVTAARD